MINVIVFMAEKLVNITVNHKWLRRDNCVTIKT